MACAPGPDNRFTPGDDDPGPGHGVSGEGDVELARFAADARIEERLAERRRERWLVQQAAESTTFAGILRNLAESATPVRLLTTAGTVHRAAISVVGRDAIGVRGPAGRLTLIALAHLTTLDTPGASVVSGDRDTGEPGPGLRHLLADLADTDTDLALVLVGGGRTEGRLLWVGEDVLAITPAHDPDVRGPACRYVRLSSVIEVSLSVSG